MSRSGKAKRIRVDEGGEGGEEGGGVGDLLLRTDDNSLPFDMLGALCAGDVDLGLDSMNGEETREAKEAREAEAEGERIELGLLRVRVRELEAVLDALPVPVWLLDKSCNVLEKNRAASHLQETVDFSNATLKELGEAQSTLSVPQPHGNVQYVTLSTADVSGGVGIQRMIVGQRAKAEELELQVERYRLSQEFTKIGTWDLSIPTGALYWTDQIAPLFGIPKGELETTYNNFLGAIHTDDRAKVRDAVEACLNDNAIYNIEHRVIWPGGEVRWLLEKGGAMRNQEGRPLRMLGVVQDITKRKRLEMELETAKKDADAASAAKSRFLASVSHELRTPLTAILGFAQLLRTDSIDPLSPGQTRLVDEIIRGGDILLSLINEVLDLAKIDSNSITLNLCNVSMQGICKTVSSLCHPVCHNTGCTLDISGPSASNDTVVMADRIRLIQAVVNLITNACKYGTRGGCVQICYGTTSNKEAFIAVHNEGEGIAIERQAHLFQAFNRLGWEGGPIEGTGLGLSIAKRLVEMMHGSITCQSGGNIQGTTFTIFLPEGQGAVVPPTIEGLQGLYSGPATETRAVPGTVLYIEDSPSNVRLLRTAFARHPKLDLITAITAEEGLSKARRLQPSLILMDLNLPGMDGFQALRHLRENSSTCHIPVVALSAAAMSDEVDRGEQAGFDGYLTKPINFTTLFRTVYTLVHRSTTPAGTDLMY